MEIEVKKTVKLKVDRFCSSRVARLYVGKAFDKTENPIGGKLKLADPMEGFQVTEYVWSVSDFKKLEMITQ